MVHVGVSPLKTNRSKKRAMPAESIPLVRAALRGGETTLQPCLPRIEISELDGTFHVHADFRMVPDAENVTVAFAQQGMIISGGTIQRYVPTPTDGEIESAKVEVADCVARISIPTEGLGHRWRAIVMW